MMTLPNRFAWQLSLAGFAGIAILVVAKIGMAVEPITPPGWDGIRQVKMSGGSRAFWDVNGAVLHQKQALNHGFDPVNLLGDYNDYPGKQKRHIGNYLKRKKPANNPWDRPDYFQEIVRQNIAIVVKKPNLRSDATSIFVHDIEFDFQQDISKAWNDPAAKKASGVATLEEFQDVYLAEWAKWYWLPCDWGKETLPNLLTGLYGPQHFRRDYWGIVGKDAKQIDGTHVLGAAVTRATL